MYGADIQAFAMNVVLLVRGFAYTVVAVMTTKLSDLFDMLTLNNPVFDVFTDIVGNLFELIGDPSILDLLLGAFIFFSVMTLIKWVLDLIPFL